MPLSKRTRCKNVHRQSVKLKIGTTRSKCANIRARRVDHHSVPVLCGLFFQKTKLVDIFKFRCAGQLINRGQPSLEVKHTSALSVALAV